MRKRIVSVMLAFAMIIALVGCTKNSSSLGTDSSQNNENGTNSNTAQDKITLTVMHNRPDETDALAKYYNEVKQRYEKMYPDVTIEYEVYDNETYKKKLQIYGTNESSMPDVFFVWSTPSEFLPYTDLALPLNQEDFANYKFTAGAFEDATVDGNLLGLPIGIDYWYLYCNQAIFKECGIEVPSVMSELEADIEVLNSKGYAPIAMNGKDLWNQSVMFNDIMLRYTNGNPQSIWDACSQKSKFAETPEFTEAAEEFKKLIDLGMFQSSWTSDDDTTGQNLFLQGRAAMWYTGTWNNAIATSEDVSEDLRNNLTVIPFPSKDGSDTSTALMGREGTTMMVSKNTKYQEESVNFLKVFFDPEYFPKASWENGIGVPMQEFNEYITESDPEALKIVADSISNATSVASAPYAFRLNSIFEEEAKNLTMLYLLGQIDVKELWRNMDESAGKNQVK